MTMQQLFNTLRSEVTANGLTKAGWRTSHELKVTAAERGRIDLYDAVNALEDLIGVVSPAQIAVALDEVSQKLP